MSKICLASKTNSWFKDPTWPHARYTASMGTQFASTQLHIFEKEEIFN
jgi:hypothetical protein